MQKQNKNVRIAVAPAKVQTDYANAFQTRFDQGEFFLEVGVSRVIPSQEENVSAVIQVDISRVIAMTPNAAQNLVNALSQSLREYEAKFGPIAPPRGD